ncbi:Ppx/GppA family phosphatase [Geomonas subterranea]|uniref:Ppx/GppA family phosphatase n=1 Tax=Geomonas subterranea TaxID=2847989 RepID=A0ABX8LNL1_9BACT|nr:Ppx/GppA phosphatase family protein [Geomonas subterranea]QXE91914.1 Ppx/GppA family phosphatase [Geomonas subterranea]QXM09995.1 Ppx/GppA family phosphatase [Geomonas subterranea]
MRQNRLAAIDIGTNSIRSIIVETAGNGKYRILDDEKVLVRLGEGLHQTGAISPAAWERAIEALSRQKKIIDGYRVASIEAVATSAMRKAVNGRELVAAIREHTGLEIEVISGEEEAELAALSAQHNFELEGVRHLIFDIGGGSLELISALGGHTEEMLSLELGAVFLTESFIKSDPVSPSEHQKLRKYIRKTLKTAYTGERTGMQCLVGSGGTVTSIAAMVAASRGEKFDSLHGYELLRSELVHLLAMLARKGDKERRALPGLNPDRSDIIVAGVTAVDELMDFFQVNHLKVNERGIREGLILRALRRRNLLPEKKRRSWRESALEFARSCHCDEGHARQVAKLSRQIFHALAKRYGWGDKELRLLDAAAVMHDVGYFISYSSHHKHSYHLIRHADLFGFTPRERELMANIARYHRKSLPKKKHDEFTRLTAADQLLVSRLGGILRLCDGLDRRRNAVVRQLDCAIDKDLLRLTLSGDEDMSVEVYGAKAKSDLLQEACRLKLVLEVRVDSDLQEEKGDDDYEEPAGYPDRH